MKLTPTSRLSPLLTYRKAATASYDSLPIQSIFNLNAPYSLSYAFLSANNESGELLPLMS